MRKVRVRQRGIRWYVESDTGEIAYIVLNKAYEAALKIYKYRNK